MKTQDDPIIRGVEKAGDTEGLSPMDAPNPLAPPSDIRAVPREELAPFLRELHDEHAAFVEDLSRFEAALSSIRERGISPEIGEQVGEFFRRFDTEFMAHHRKEERHLFPVLRQALLDSGEHGADPDPHTSVELMEDDHLHAVQLAAVVFNFLGLASRLRDADSRRTVLELAVQQGDALVEHLRLHVFREDNIIIPLAQQLVEEDVLAALGR